MMCQTIQPQQRLAVDIGGTAAKYALVSPSGTIAQRGKFRTVEITCFEDFFAQLCEVVRGAQAQGIAQVGISSPGMYLPDGSCYGNVENLPFLSNQNIPARLKEQFPEMQFQIGNDGVAAAMGEYRFGAAQNCPSFICITLGTGIGGALVLDGKPHLGHHFQSCEIGYTNYRNHSDYYEKKYSTKGILRYLAAQLGVESVSGRAFTDQVQQGDPIYCAVFQEWVDGIGQLIANMMLIIDPEMVVIGGGISREETLLLPALTQAVQVHLPEGFSNKCNLKMAQCGNDAGLLGAVSF